MAGCTGRVRATLHSIPNQPWMGAIDTDAAARSDTANDDIVTGGLTRDRDRYGRVAHALGDGRCVTTVGQCAACFCMGGV